MSSSPYPNQRWHLQESDPALISNLSQKLQCAPLLAQVLVNRGWQTEADIKAFLEPESLILPPPHEVFENLGIAVELLSQAIAQGQKITICGDYDADGMTSTALLLRALRHLGANIDYEIPSRMQEGYGINSRIVEDCHRRGIKLILTVDNGISALEPIQRARELGIAVIVTDHHDIPPELPPAEAILNPKLLPPDSPYASLAGVGVAYVLAISLAQRLGQVKGLVRPLRELCTLGTIADLAALTGVNRRWVKQGLQTIPQSNLAGIQALMLVSDSLPNANSSLKPTAVGFRLGPRINAIGRIGDPQVVIDLLTTDDSQEAQALAEICEATNKERQNLCTTIEEEAIALVEESGFDPEQERVLVILKSGWHHGVIGIVASRLLERYGVPVFIATPEDGNHLRGSARGIPEFDVFAALQDSADLLEKFGGHRAAGGFSLKTENLDRWRSRLRDFAHRCLEPEYLRPLVTLDAEISLADISWELYESLENLQPFGMGNPEPIFSSRGVRVLEQSTMGASQAHLKFTLGQENPHCPSETVTIPAKAWRWGDYYPLPQEIDIAYKLRSHNWRGQTTLELELAGFRPTVTTPVSISIKKNVEIPWDCPEPPNYPSPNWQPLDDLGQCLAHLRGDILIYGDQRPYVAQRELSAQIHYDRPRQVCPTFIFWTLPPSWSHLRWLLAIGKPNTVYLAGHRPRFPQGVELQAKLSIHLGQLQGQAQPKLNLLALGQTHWVAPRTIVAALRGMGYPCTGFKDTLPLEQEIEHLQQWYQRRAEDFLVKLSESP
ncbi:single-stranded-DNA-specific exonuclease RecJ [Candidatus Synechococcus calcipolaris G9]|uniref:Single-stranded-DNA-specific exonuclease RecJ n=1 Tax=Candidatus Synechococcus calcipolaris G9 TaxID=1497997 RepID=A0ABT6F0S4_9SYNE|nr:single-stranded-DNA-specific exonuclease RecJ [Candidatus Synechococcus calcipolaris]MDG2991403.1 single-stranded-DNA-specific exonuclease RecJ [Candidatus Synechococcus calcipolaris G9]